MAETKTRRVVVTGIGAVTPLGLNAQETWSNALKGQSGIGKITHFDITGCPIEIAGEVKGFDVSKPFAKPLKPAPGQEVLCAMNTKEARKVGRFCHLGVAAGIEAYVDAGLDEIRDSIDANRFGVNIGAGMGGLPEIEAVHDDLLAKGYKRVTPFFILQAIPSMPSGQLSILLNLRGPNLCNVSACSSSAHSIGESYHVIKRGDADLMMAGGAEAVIGRLAIAGFASMRALSTRNDSPQTASRPYDKDRDGFVMGEGGAVLILEEYEHAKKRGAKIYGEIKGYGLSGDAYHQTSPAPEGEGGGRAMEMALKASGLRAEDIHYVNTHGTSTPAGDVEEARAVLRVMPNAAQHLQISSTKSMTGHLLGAAGALEAIFSLLAIKEGKIPPTINLENLDPAAAALGLNFTPKKMAERRVDNAMSNSFGFGGTNACLIVGRVV